MVEFEIIFVTQNSYHIPSGNCLQSEILIYCFAIPHVYYAPYGEQSKKYFVKDRQTPHPPHTDCSPILSCCCQR